MGSVLEPSDAASQRSGSSEHRNETRAVKKVLELEIYAPRERHGKRETTSKRERERERKTDRKIEREKERDREKKT